MIILLVFGRILFIQWENISIKFYIFQTFIAGFFGYKLYLSIMEKEVKKERKTKKQLKEEKKAASPPSSPSSKKQN
jgi:predicted membrane protein